MASKKIQIVGLDLPQVDWAQTDETQLDYIKNKEVAKRDLSPELQELIDNKADADEVLHLSGGELTGELYTSAPTPLLIGRDGKIGLRAQPPKDQKTVLQQKYRDVNDDQTLNLAHVGQINVSNSWWNKGEGETQDQWGAQISAFNGRTGKYSHIRVSHEGLEYIDTNGGKYQVLYTGQLGIANGVATLDENGHIPSTQLPAYTDGIVEGYISADKTQFYTDEAKTENITPEVGENNNKIFLDLDTLCTYRWSGTTFAMISESLALGETSNTAYYGDKGKIAYDHSTIKYGNPHGVTAEMTGALPLSGGTMAGPINLGTNGWINGTTASDNHFSIFGLVEPTRLQVGGTYPALEFKGSNDRPTYNGEDMAMMRDIIPTLPSTNDGTDRTQEMQTILDKYGYLKLGAGEFYLASQLKIGNGAVLEGCGAATKIMQTPDTTQPSMIWLKSEGTIKNVCLQGEWTEKPTEETAYKARRIGIVLSQGTHNAMIANCFIRGWTGQGILCDNNFMSTYSVLISDCDICLNNIGLKLSEKHEYACISHCIFHNNIYGVQNNAGNNKFTACGFDSNVEGFCISGGYNNGHGSAVGCTFNHNSKCAVRISDNELGYIFSSCNFAEGAIIINTAVKGTLFSGCRFGNWMQYQNYSTSPTAFEGCIFSHSPKTESKEFVDDYGGFKFVDCMNYNSGEILDSENESDGNVDIGVCTVENWVFTLKDGTVIEKSVLLDNSGNLDAEEWNFTLDNGEIIKKRVVINV